MRDLHVNIVHRSRAAALLALLLACAVVAVYLPALGYDFVTLDDLDYVRDNLLVRAGLTARGAWGAFRVQEQLWIPLTWLSFMTEVSLAGMSPGVFHATNILLHACGASLLLLVLWRMTGSLRASAFAAALTALHPLRVESVAWITERKDVLSLFLLLLALACWLRRVRSGTTRWYVAAAALYALSLMAKPLPVSFPLLLLVFDFWPLGRLAVPGGTRGRVLVRLVLEKIPLLALAAAVSVVTLVGQRQSLRPLPVSGRIELLVTAPLIHLGRTFWPADAGIRFFPGNMSFQPAVVLAAALALGALTALAFRAGRKRPYLAAGWAWYLVALLPVSGVASTGTQWIADRFTYLPHVGLAVSLVWAASEFLRERPSLRRCLFPVAAAVLLVLAVSSRRQLHAWRDGVSLMRQAVALDPASPLARAELGHALLDRGDAATAIGELRATLELDPGSVDARYNLAVALAGLGRNEEAIREYRELLDRSASDLMARLNLAELFYGAKRLQEAAAEFAAVAERVPGTVEGEFSRGRVLEAQGRLEDARASYRAARSLPSALPDVPSSLKELLKDW